MTQLSDAEIAELERLHRDMRGARIGTHDKAACAVLLQGALMRHAGALIAAAKAQRDDGWRTMESAPKGRKLLVGYYNDGGKWRTITATYYLPKTLDASDDNGDEDGFAPEGWYEESETYEEILRCQTPTHWRPLPAPPSPQETE